MPDAQRVLDLKARLKRAWIPFFSRFGRLLPIQVAAIPAILDGCNVVIASPTASGKTEAVVAPLAENLLRDGIDDGLAAIYISPTRALVNDTEVRCKEPLSEVGISCAVRTGDRRQFRPPKGTNFLITTPESLDSILCRCPEALVSLRAIVLDEIHLLDNTYRGDQLRILVRRAERLRRTPVLHLYALSATLGSAEDVAARYMDEFVIIEQPGQREIDYSAVPSLSQAIQLARTQGLRKLLVFANSRRKVEETAAELSSLVPAGKIVAHHGSLSKQQREEAERFMRESSIGVCVATSTLEIGIDIGDIDAVILVDPPWSVSSLLQRVGRGNRRARVARAIAVYSSGDELLAYDRLVYLARQGAVGSDAYEPDLSVVVQQTFSLLFGSPQGIDDHELWCYFEGFCAQEEWEQIMQHLQYQRLIEKRGGRWYATDQVMDMGERGRLHSNIPDEIDRKVVDITTGQVVGEVAGTVDELFALAGRIWKVTQIRDAIIYVKPGRGESPAPFFRTHRPRGAFHQYLPDSLKQRP